MIPSKWLTKGFAALPWLLAFLPLAVQADDPCEDAKKTVRNMVHSWDRSVSAGVIDGRFHVQRISRGYDILGYRVTYQGGGKVFFEKRIPAHTSDFTTHFTAATLDNGKALIYQESYGAGGSMQCRSTIFRTSRGFGSRFR
jgi:hypothetical protein